MALVAPLLRHDVEHAAALRGSGLGSSMQSCMQVYRSGLRRGDGFVLFDYSPNGVYLNGAPLSAAPAIELTQEEETEAELIAGPASLPWRAGRAVRFGDRISLMVCASPHAEICYQLLPASEQSWGWISSQVEAERACW